MFISYKASTTYELGLVYFESLALHYSNAKPVNPPSELEDSFLPTSLIPSYHSLHSFYPHSVLRQASGMPAETCPQLVRVGKTTTAYTPPNMSITRFGSEAQHHASPPR